MRLAQTNMRLAALALALGCFGVGCGGTEQGGLGARSAGLIDAQGTVQAIAEGKCQGWGYDAVTLPAHHAACVRMTMADYCGDGRSFTMNGTRIDLYDDLGINKDTTPAASPFRLEAIWSGEGARARLVCLSKARWDTLPPGGVNCPAQPLRDPRLHTIADVCDDLTWEQWRALSVGNPPFKVRLGNDSAFLDKGLYRWRSGMSHYTTAASQYDSAPAGYVGPPSFEGAAFWGTEVDAVYPGVGAYLVPLLECERLAPLDRWTTTAPPNPALGYTCSVTQARVFSPALDPQTPPSEMSPELRALVKGQARALWSYRHNLGPRHVTVMDGNPTPPLYGADARLEGYVLHRVP